MYVGRYAPSPTGDLHLGNALAALGAWARARRAGGTCLLRMEDLDAARVVAGSAAGIVDDLRALGLVFDGDVVVQSERRALYEAALARLIDDGRIYACACSRKDLARAASAPHAGEEGPPYPGTCRERSLSLDDPRVAWRFRVPPGVVVVDDALAGPYAQDVARDVGDFVVKRKDGVVAYQLAVVVDDAAQGVTEIVRGRDLLSSAPRQRLLFEALGHAAPRFAHLPLWVGDDGHRLAKRGGAGSLHSMIEREGAAAVLGRIGRALGVCAANEELAAPALAARLDDEVLRVAVITDAGTVAR